jgi:hypothetical protein
MAQAPMNGPPVHATGVGSNMQCSSSNGCCCRAGDCSIGSINGVSSSSSNVGDMPAYPAGPGYAAASGAWWQQQQQHDSAAALWCDL